MKRSFYKSISYLFLPHWSRGKCVSLLIMRSRFDSWHFYSFKCGLGLEQGPPSLVRTIGQLLDGEVENLIKKIVIIGLDGA